MLPGIQSSWPRKFFLSFNHKVNYFVGNTGVYNYDVVVFALNPIADVGKSNDFNGTSVSFLNLEVKESWSFIFV